MKSTLLWIYIAFLFILFFLLTLPVFLITFPFDKYRKAPNWVFMQIGYFMLWPFAKKGVSFSGLENFKEGEPMICISNHQSFLDMPLIAQLPWKMKWISKKEMFFIPVVGWLMFMTGQISINRSKGSKAAKKLDAAVPYIQKGNPLMIFPEGTRTKTGRIQTFKRGAFSLAFDNGFKILPMVINGTSDILPTGAKTFNSSGMLSIDVLPALDPKDFSGWEEMMHHAHHIMEEKFTTNFVNN